MFQASHRKLAYVVCGQNRRRLLEASMGWYIRHHWHGMVWHGKIWHGMARYGMRGHIRHHCQDNVSHRFEDRSVARMIVLIPKVLETPCVCRAHCRSCQCDKNFLKFWKFCSSEVILHRHVFAQTFFHLSLATQFGRHSWQGVGKGLEHRHWLPGARGARGALLIAQLNWLVNFAFLYLLTIEAQSH